MIPITALLNAKNDASRLGRCLETLYPCDEILVIDHGSTDETVHVAREYGSKILGLNGSADARVALRASRFISKGWVLCLDPREALTEALAASLFEWKLNADVNGAHRQAFAVLLREENANGWTENPVAQTRLVPATWSRWNGMFPANEGSSSILKGKLLRFAFP